MKTVENPKSIALVGRRWYNPADGNTYNTCEVVIDGELAHQTPIRYGFGDHYQVSASEWLKKYLPEFRGNDGGLCLRLWAEKNEITFRATAVDVARKKDL